jgi:hypothetical protein
LGFEASDDGFGVVGDEFLMLLAGVLGESEGTYVRLTAWSHSWSCMPGSFGTGLMSWLRCACIPRPG